MQSQSIMSMSLLYPSLSDSTSERIPHTHTLKNRLGIIFDMTITLTVTKNSEQ